MAKRARTDDPDTPDGGRALFTSPFLALRMDRDGQWWVSWPHDPGAAPFPVPRGNAWFAAAGAHGQPQLRLTGHTAEGCRLSIDYEVLGPVCRKVVTAPDGVTEFRIVGEWFLR